MTARRGPSRAQRAPATASVELAILLPLAMLLVLGLLGVARLTVPLLGVSAAAREAARAGTLGLDAGEAEARARARGAQVGADYGLGNGSLRIDPDVTAFAPDGTVRVTVSYTVHLADVPLVRLGDITLRRSDAEPVGLWRSLRGN
jgi:Flp pilus assembly protein TadG